MSAKASILWDIDGVLYPDMSTHLDDPDYNYTNVRSGWASWWVDPNDGQFMRDLWMITDQYWCSSWESDSNALVEAFHLPEPLPYLEFGKAQPEDSLVFTYKLPDVKEWYIKTKPQKLVWVDDELQQDAYIWAAALPIPTLLIKTDPRDGLTSMIKKEILSFVTP